MSGERKKKSPLGQDNLQALLGDYFIFHIYNLDYTCHFELQKDSA